MDRVIYPATMLVAVAMQWLLMELGFSVTPTAYGIILTAALWITVLERAYPARQTWSPAWGDVKQDGTFMLAIQIALPKLLGLSVAITLLQFPALSLGDYWPHHAPVLFQAVLMLLSADFLRYWLHRAAHEISWLWRFHAVHHSPGKLYWLNVGRFHPVDKGLQFLLDALPFILLGVGEDVLGIYFVFYAVNGFFQHCNIRLHFGWLNYLVSSAELHRWHHSQSKSESDRNYGNNLIVWDLLFGTRFLPEDRQVGDLGLTTKDYPETFWWQMIEPFRGNR